jgi:hypothetical protein
VRRLILFHGKRHRGELAEAEVSALVTHLAVRSRVGVSTQNQALAALLFLEGRSTATIVGGVSSALRFSHWFAV